MNIDDLKSDWKSQQKPGSSAKQEIDPTSLLNSFEKVQHKTKKENIILSITLSLTIAFLWGMVYFLGNTSWWVYTGVIIMTVEMIATAAFAWYRNSLKKWGNVQSNSYNYILAAIKKLKYRKFLMIYVMPMYGLLLITGINLVYIDVISELSSTLRWVIHLSVSGILAVFFIVQIARRLKKERREIDPLIEELQAMKEGLE